MLIRHSDLEHLLVGRSQGRDTGRQVPLIPVTNLIVVCEKPVVIAVEAFAKPANLRVPARMPLPEFPDRLLIQRLPNSRPQRLPAYRRHEQRRSQSKVQEVR